MPAIPPEPIIASVALAFDVGKSALPSIAENLTAKGNHKGGDRYMAASLNIISVHKEGMTTTELRPLARDYFRYILALLGREILNIGQCRLNDQSEQLSEQKFSFLQKYFPLGSYFQDARRYRREAKILRKKASVWLISFDAMMEVNSFAENIKKCENSPNVSRL